MASKKMVRTEVGEREYDLLSNVAKKKGLTIKEAARRAIFEWSRSGTVLKEDPFFKLRPTKSKRRIKSYQLDRMRLRAKRSTTKQ